MAARNWNKTIAAGPTERDRMQAEWMRENIPGVDWTGLSLEELVMLAVKSHGDYQRSEKNIQRSGYVGRTEESIGKGGATTAKKRLEEEALYAYTGLARPTAPAVEPEAPADAPVEDAPVEAPKPRGRGRRTA